MLLESISSACTLDQSTGCWHAVWWHIQDSRNTSWVDALGIHHIRSCWVQEIWEQTLVHGFLITKQLKINIIKLIMLNFKTKKSEGFLTQHRIKQWKPSLLGGLMFENHNSCLHSWNCIVCSIISISYFFLGLQNCITPNRLEIRSWESWHLWRLVCFITQVVNYAFTTS